MENKQNHIDDFLRLRLQDLEARPDDAAWKTIAHSFHPTDMALADALKRLQETPPESVKKAILYQSPQTFHPIDIALYDRLAEFESDPKTKFSELAYHEKKTKRRFLFIWIFPAVLLTALIVYFIINNSGNENGRIPQNNSLAETQSPNSSSNSDELEVAEKPIPKLDFQNQTNNSIPPLYPNKNTSNKNDKTISTKQLEETFILENTKSNLEEILLSYWHISPIPEQEIQFVNDSFSASMGSLLRFAPKKKISPFGLNLSFGLQNEISVNESSPDQNIHKDALSNFKQSTAETRQGYNLSLQLSYLAFKRLQFKTGLSYSHSSKTSNFDYLYDEIPVYGIGGNIIGYFRRPAAQSPLIKTPVLTVTSSLSIPIQSVYQFFSSKKVSIWAGGGFDFKLQNTLRSKIFNFDEEEMGNVQSNQSNKIQPRLQIQALYSLKPGLSLSLHLEGLYRKQTVISENIRYQTGIFIPSFNFGLTYNPVLKK